MQNISAKDYDIYLAAIKAANDSKDKEALRQIQKQLVAQYGISDDVKRLLSYFRYSV